MLIGIDIVDIQRIKEVVIRTPRFLKRIYTEAELDYCLSKSNPYPSLAARFAAREAFRKLDYTFQKGVGFRDVEVKIDEFGKPYLYLSKIVIEKCEHKKIKEINISLSHSKNQAIAAVVATRED
ncbi:Holo-[acyl-carrier protein] synthase [Candidatus Syntrophocurvum alkaliphilum]|uniref:Holo-[acyl-carrier-protein] synthase n=1 Tax=Candidatus Syntrophocurvum alkaliphilum TaxID=2293317 RepID=A0A6I6DDQ6_9FIRM|nr:holo-ACP synthase [Candidatus Syntrophocurvum alkaliphilum]QGT98738.1 Holo-[acyl-carrier protein] synthase [Candidatus Syntrophocurvum alkaliphilum]